MRILSFDPGETTGWCYQDPDKIINFGQAKGLAELMDVCEKHVGIVDHVVIEDYIVLGKKAMSHSGSRVPTIQMIGYLKAWCIQQKLGSPTLYPARLKPLQQAQIQLKPIGAHKDNHWVDAANHGRWYLIQKKLAKTALEIKWHKENNPSVG
jgi:hypothetical protein